MSNLNTLAGYALECGLYDASLYSIINQFPYPSQPNSELDTKEVYEQEKAERNTLLGRIVLVTSAVATLGIGFFKRLYFLI
jgi:hypothetical protein